MRPPNTSSATPSRMAAVVGETGNGKANVVADFAIGTRRMPFLGFVSLEYLVPGIVFFGLELFPLLPLVRKDAVLNSKCVPVE